MAVEVMQKHTTPASVLICTRNRPQDLEFALPTILAQDYPNFEIVLIDQSTNDDTEHLVRKLCGSDPRLRYIRTSTVGLSIARNMALTEAKHDICAFTDDDCEVPANWLSNVVATYARYPDIHILFSPVHVPKDLMNQPGLRFPSLYFEDSRVLRYKEIYGMGANMSMRKSFWEVTGPFDPMLGPGAPLPGSDEHDWLYRAHLAGAVIRLEPKNAILHRAYREEEKWNSLTRTYAYGDAAFAMKHLRCGDLSVLPMMFHRLFYIGGRGVLRFFQRNPGWRYEYNYAAGYWQGLWGSLAYKVDHHTRLFVRETPPAASGDFSSGVAKSVV